SWVSVLSRASVHSFRRWVLRRGQRSVATRRARRSAAHHLADRAGHNRFGGVAVASVCFGRHRTATPRGPATRLGLRRSAVAEVLCDFQTVVADIAYADDQARGAKQL